MQRTLPLAARSDVATTPAHCRWSRMYHSPVRGRRGRGRRGEEEEGEAEEGEEGEGEEEEGEEERGRHA